MLECARESIVQQVPESLLCTEPFLREGSEIVKE